MELDPGTLRERRWTRLPGLGGRSGPLITSTAAGEGAVWAIGLEHLYRIDPATMAVTSVPGRSPDAMLAAGGVGRDARLDGGADRSSQPPPWGTATGSRRTRACTNSHPATGRSGSRAVRRPGVADRPRGRRHGALHPGRAGGLGRRLRRGIGVGRQRHRRDGDADRPAGRIGRDVCGRERAAADRRRSRRHRRLGRRRRRPIATDGPVEGLETLPSSSCGPAVYGGEGPPDVLIASDLPLNPRNAVVTQPMVQAIEFVLREHGFRAGDFQGGLPVDDATAQVGDWDSGKCEANAQSYVDTPGVVGVIGTFNSGCALLELPILNAAELPVAMVPPTNSYVGLTKETVGTSPGDPDRPLPVGSAELRPRLPGRPRPDAGPGRAGEAGQRAAGVRVPGRAGRAVLRRGLPTDSPGTPATPAFGPAGPCTRSVAPARLDRLTASLAAGGGWTARSSPESARLAPTAS